MYLVKGCAKCWAPGDKANMNRFKFSPAVGQVPVTDRPFVLPS
jgi:hypothetical protein